ncbi:ABC transporter ATP-binding protein [Candidatus Poribacteria bacterium]|nr:ABC transporter ATP-binding protein [Candidatus Poribacteria bacterium]MCH2574136.1 ABC transporter ATP-binding protein [Candidatus Poribacteria bacterium]|tara:strand:+ start:3795 stop:4571 length:777 start_codon:yes stop_codon:yes gene_type:complete
MVKPILEIFSLTKNFGGVVALNEVDLKVMPGQITSLIGPNGAGKTTLFNCLTGLISLTTGRIQFQQTDMSGMAAHRITSSGIARTFQNIRLFSEMTVLDNVKIGLHTQSKGYLWSAISRNLDYKKEEEQVTTSAYQLLEFVNLAQFSHQQANNLSYGDQRRLEIARALATEPKLLLLDEPAAGMNPQETNELIHLIHNIKSRGITIFLIEHDMKLVMQISEWITVLDYGEKISQGPPDVVQSDPLVISAYLGQSLDKQ